MPIIAGPDKAKPKSVASIIVNEMGKEKMEGPAPEGDGEFLAQQFMAAVNAKDAKRVYMAFKALFQHCELEPHSEYESEDE